MPSLSQTSPVESDADENIQKDMVPEMIENVSTHQELVQVQETAWESAKKNPKVIMYSIGACASSMLWGFDIGMCTFQVEREGSPLSDTVCHPKE